jgi:hypothetical protein
MRTSVLAFRMSIPDPTETLGGRYELEFRLASTTGWRINKRRLVRRYVIGDPMLADHARTSGMRLLHRHVSAMNVGAC